MCSGWGQGPGGTRCWATGADESVKSQGLTLEKCNRVALERFVVDRLHVDGSSGRVV